MQFKTLKKLGDMVSHLGSFFIPLRSSRQSCPVPCFRLYSPTSFLSSRHRHTYVYMTFPFRSLQGISNFTCLKQNLVFLLKLASSYIPSPVLLHLVNGVIIHKLLLPKLGAILNPLFLIYLITPNPSTAHPLLSPSYLIFPQWPSNSSSILVPL